ncbi:MAG: ABC transporter permease subunit, partial [Oligoflexia bacterium]|nr:ABC transporter permease subunit [Oligoflexia bacterium]
MNIIDNDFLFFWIKFCKVLSSGLLITLKLSSFAALFSFTLGILLGTIRCQRIRKRITLLATAIDATTFILRAIPYYVQLLIFYFVVPDFLGLNLDAMYAAMISLGVCSSAYVSQIV